jgi:GTPase SAR1 family protein
MKTEEEETYKGLGDPTLLEKIDKLFACNVGEHVNLPQLVVVGDQSSGKSSVLEGLMKLPFPRDSGLCTRFATQIIFRRSSIQNILVSIIPDGNATPEHAEKVRAWSTTDLKTLDASSFARIMDEVRRMYGERIITDTYQVNVIMGLSSQQERFANTGSTFSNDVLRLEISGPDEEHLSVIDVPGIFKNTTSGFTTKADIALVRNMVQGYMDNPRSVMLTVIPANVDVATQEILELAADADPEGLRTLGVLTKPDLVDQGAEPRVVDLIAGRAHVIKLGWHLVRNPGQKQLSDPSHDRQSLENHFFQTQAPWNSLDKSRVGIEALRIRLQEVLATHITREFPKVGHYFSSRN